MGSESTMTTMNWTEDSEFWKNLDRYLVKLQDEDKAARRATLKTIFTAVKHSNPLRSPYKLDNDPQAQGENTEMASLNLVESQLAMFVRPVVCCCMTDASEKCREIAYDILGEIFERFCSQRGGEQIPNVLPQFRAKFGNSEINETCEEVRLAAYNFILRLLTHLPQQIDPCVPDLIPICVNGFRDAFVEIKLVTCKITNIMAQYGRQNFYNMAHELTGSMSTAMGHAQQRIRKAVIGCVAPVVLHGHYKCFDPLFHALTLRVFDRIPEVRLVFIEIVGHLMLDYTDRYSCFHKLVPLLFTGLLDQNPAVQEQAKKFWCKAGEKFLLENSEEYKNEVDFPLLARRAGACPPTLGCKILATQNVGKLLPGIKNEISVSELGIRQKSIELLYCLMSNCEEKITMHVNEIMDCLVKAALDEQESIKELVDKSADLLGVYVQFPTIWPLLKIELEQVSNAGRHYAALRITVGVLHTANSSTVDPYRKEIALLIYQKSICQTKEERKQIVLVEFCAALLSPEHSLLANEIDHELFYILMSVSALTQSNVVMKMVAGQVHKLVSALKLSTVEELMGKYFGPILKDLKQSSGHWTRESPDKLLFELICQHGGLAAQENWSTISDIMVMNLTPDKDPKVRLDLLTRFSVQLSENKDRSEQNKPKFQKLLQILIKDVLDPNMAWRAGETAASLRIAALGTLHAILEGHYVNGKAMYPIASQIFANLLPMLSESMEIARVMTCQVIQLIMNECGDLGVGILHKAYPELLKRLDDSSVKVRIAASRGLAALFSHTSEDYGTQFGGQLQYVYSILLLHLDDVEEGVRQSVLATLQIIGHRNPENLIQECEKIRDKLRLPLLCDEITNTFQKLNIRDGNQDASNPPDPAPENA